MAGDQKTIAAVGTRAELVKRAGALVEGMRSRAEETEQLRRLPDQSLDEIRGAGLHRMLQPARFGGVEAHFSGMIDVVSALAAGCASSGWVLTQYISHNCLLGGWPLEGQEEVWRERPDAMVAGSLVPSCGRAERTGDTWRLSGRWPFASGVWGCDWFIAAASPRRRTAPSRPACSPCRAPRSRSSTTGGPSGCAVPGVAT